MATTPTTPAVRKFLAENAAAVEYSHPQLLEFTSRHNGRQFAMFVKPNGSMDRAYRMDSGRNFTAEISSLGSLMMAVTA